MGARTFTPATLAAWVRRGSGVGGSGDIYWPKSSLRLCNLCHHLANGGKGYEVFPSYHHCDALLEGSIYLEVRCTETKVV